MVDEPESPKLRKVSHIGLWILCLGLLAWTMWAAFHGKNNTKNNSFASGSKQSNVYHITRNYALASLNLALLPLTMRGCTRADKIEDITTDEPANEVVDTKQMINAVKEEYQ